MKDGRKEGIYIKKLSTTSSKCCPSANTVYLLISEGRKEGRKEGKKG